MRYAVLVLNDLKLIRIGLASMFQDSALMMVAEAETVEQAWEVLQTQPIDLLIMEARLAGRDCLPAIQGLKVDFPELPILVFSNCELPAVMARANLYGAAGFLPMSTARATLLAACQRAIGQENLWTGDELRRIASASGPWRGDSDWHIPLTTRERQVLGLICCGTSNKEMAVKLEIGFETVKEHVQHILRKLGVADRTQAAVWATRIGLF